jgi:hypothetical protein
MSPALAMCLRKRQYSKVEAQRVVALSHRQRPQDGQQHAYRCGLCGAWHIGHQRRRGRR